MVIQILLIGQPYSFTYFERAVIIMINRIRRMSRHMWMWVSGMMRMIRHHATATVMMPVATHALSRLQAGIGGGGVTSATAMR